MNEGYYKLAKQVGGRGVFAAVRLSVRESGPPTRIDVRNEEKVPTHHACAAEAGIRYAWEQLVLEGQQPPAVDVQILEVTESPTDTRTMFVVYAACMAFCDAIGLQLLRPVGLDLDGSYVRFPFGRSGNA